MKATYAKPCQVATRVKSDTHSALGFDETTGLYRNLSETHRKLVETSARDGLTGVFNRAYFDERFTGEL
jgi:PleD family two-component response regulator